LIGRTHRINRGTLLMDDHQLSSVLQLINAVRKLCDLPSLPEIPKGVSPDDPEAEIVQLCPLAMAIPETWVAGTFIHTRSERVGRIVSGVFKKNLENSPDYQKARKNAPS